MRMGKSAGSSMVPVSNVRMGMCSGVASCLDDDDDDDDNDDNDDDCGWSVAVCEVFKNVEEEEEEEGAESLVGEEVA